MNAMLVGTDGPARMHGILNLRSKIGKGHTEFVRPPRATVVKVPTFAPDTFAPFAVALYNLKGPFISPMHPSTSPRADHYKNTLEPWS